MRLRSILVALAACAASVAARAQAERDYRVTPGDELRIAASFVNHNRDPLSIAFALAPGAVRDAMAEFGFSNDETRRMAEECLGCSQQEYDRRVEEYYRSRAVGWRVTPAGARRLHVDVPAVVERNRPRLRAIAAEFDRLATARGYGPEDTIGAMVAFVQAALVYQSPPDGEGGRDILGFYPPPKALAAGIGDCDTKSALLAALMTNFKGMRMIGVHVPRHYLVGVARVPRQGDAFIEYRGEPFVLIEPSGPARLPPGMIGPATQAALATMSEVRIDPLF